jgi:hypothetical protein
MKALDRRSLVVADATDQIGHSRDEAHLWEYRFGGAEL